MKITEQLRSTANHEAGHAVAAVIQDLRIEYSTIKPTKDSRGSTLSPGVFGYEPSGKRAQKRTARANILKSFAGFQAERIFNPDADKRLSQDDENNVFWLSRTYCVFPRYMNHVGDDYHQDYLEKLRREANKLLRRHWESVQAVADALLEHKKLSYDQVQAIVSK